MSERKVINKYYPVDFDPSKIERVKRPKNEQSKVRIALPMSVQCINCGNYMARNSKFNARKETVVHEEYLGLKVFRFYFRCSKCFAELTFKTDPKNSDYVCENGLKPGYVAHVAAASEEEAALQEQEAIDAGDTMKILEKKSMDSMAEMEINEAIDDVLLLKSRRALLSAEELHQRALQAAEKYRSLDPTIDDSGLEDEDLAELYEMQQKYQKKNQLQATTIINGKETPLKRFDDDDDDENDPIIMRSKLAMQRMKENQAKKVNQNDSGSNETGNQSQQNNQQQLQQEQSQTNNQNPNNSSNTFKVPAIPSPLISSIKVKPNVIISTAVSSNGTSSTIQNKPSLGGLVTGYRRRDDEDE